MAKVQKFQGLEVLNQFPFNVLKNEKLNNYPQSWMWKHVEGWGELQVPTFGQGLRTYWNEKDFILFVEEFKTMYQEEPIFTIHPDEVWFNKIQIENEKFNNDREQSRKLTGEIMQNFK